MQKYSLLLLCLLFSTTAFARAWKSHMKDSHVELEVHSSVTEPLNSTDAPSINGHFCVKKEKRQLKCETLTPEDLSKYDIKFFYPNIAHEITKDVILTLKEDRHEFSFPGVSVAPNEKPVFIAQIVNKGSKVELYQKMLAKVRTLKEKLLEKRTHWPTAGTEKIVKLTKTLETLEARVLAKLQGESALIAKREFPLQINNNVSKPSVWVNAIEEWQVEANINLGLSFEGEKSWINLAFTPYQTNNDEWKIEYWLDGASLKSQLLTDPKAIYSEKFLTSQLFSGKHDLRVSVTKNRKEIEKGKNKEKWDLVFEKTYTFSTFSDSVVPAFTNLSPAPGRYVAKNSHSLNVIVDDLRGRIEVDSVKAMMDLEDGEVRDLTGNLSVLTNGDVLIPNVHGGQEGSTSYKIFGNLADLPEGKHWLHLRPRDFAGNEAVGGTWNLVYDRTPPVLLIPQSIPTPRNSKSANIDVSVSDMTGIILRLSVNGIPQTEIKNESGSIAEVMAIFLYEGTNFVTLQAIDEAGNFTDFNLPPVFVDTIPPVLSNITPKNSEVLKTLGFKVSGTSNEILSKVIIDGKETVLNSNTFSVNVSQAAEGKYTSEIRAFDAVGNETVQQIDYSIVLKLIRIELVSLEPEDGQIRIKGLPGASNSGLEIDITGGFFNSETITVEADGSFTALLDYSSYYKLSASDSVLNRSETYSLAYNADTTFTGIVKDINDEPIPGVRVLIETANQETKTDGNGVFVIAKPITGDHTVLIDGTTVPDAYTKGLKSYSKIRINVALGNLQRNVLDRIIYLTPILHDGTETEIVSGQETIVTSEHAPGVSLTIPADSARFPTGVTHKINIMEIPAEKTSIELLEFSEPTNVYALEPSGLNFSEPVKLTLPNPNEFPVGMELMIMSKNSETGFWEPDGVATVLTPDTIETKEGQGITHFSEVYATPYGVQLEAYAPKHKPGIYNEEGALETKISLPTYKAMGKDFGVNLSYNSLWAKPSVFVTNSINTPTHHVVRDVSSSAGGWLAKAKVKGYIEEWMRPEYLKSQFISGDVSTPWLYFDVTNPPKESTVSYSVDMSNQETGAYPANATYVLQYRYIKVQRIQVKVKKRFGRTRTKHYNEDISQLMDAIFPPPLQTNLFLQNKRNSEFGSGWKLNLNEKIHHPYSDRVVVEETTGKLTPYVLKNTVENLYSDSALSSMSPGLAGKVHIFKRNEVGVLEDGHYSKLGTLPPRPITIGVNQYYKMIASRAYFRCSYSKSTAQSPVIPVAGIVNGDTVLTLDTESRLIYNKNFNTVLSAGAMQVPPYYFEEHSGTQSIYNYRFPYPSNYCSRWTDGDCGNYTFQDTGYNSTRAHWTIRSGCEVAFPHLKQYGLVPTVGYANGYGSNSEFNQPRSIIQVSPDEYLIADRGNNVIRRFNLRDQYVSVYAGSRQTYDNGDGGAAVNASIFHPNALTLDKFGNVYVASERGYIRKIDPQGIISHVAGRPRDEGGVFKDYGPMKDMFFNDPRGLAVDSDNGYLYVADTGNHRIVQLDLTTGNAKVIVGTNTCVPNDILPGKAALATSICSPSDLIVDSEGNLIYLDKTNKLVRKVLFGKSADGVQRYAALNVNDTSELIRNDNGEFLRKFRDKSFNAYSKDGRHLTSTDRLGNLMTFSYSNDLLSQVTDPAGRITQFSYNSGLLDSIEDPAGRVTSFNYFNRNLSSVTYPDGTSQSFAYSDDGLMLEESDKKGAKTQYLYNAWNKLTKVIFPDNSKREFVDGLAPTYVSGNITPEAKAPVTSNPTITDILKDAKGVETYLTKDRTGEITKITDHQGRVTEIERDLKGRPIKIIKFDGSYNQFSYNEIGDLISKYDSASDTSESFEYNAFGFLTKYTNTLNQTKQIFYDNNGNPIQEKDPSGNSVYRNYFANGLVSSASNNLNEVVSYLYDQYGNMQQVTAPQSETTSYVRDDAGNTVEKINAKGISTVYAFDEFNRLSGVTTGVSASTPVGDTTSYAYTPNGQLASMFDPKSNKTLYEYDLMDRLIKKTNPLGQINLLAYDGNSNVVWERDPNGNIKNYEYNKDNQLVRKVLADNLYDISYDEFGNITTITDSDSALSYAYTEIGGKHLVSSVTSTSEDFPARTLEYQYNQLGIKKSTVTPYGTFNYGHDASNRLTSVKNHLGETFTFSYDSASRITQIARPGSFTSLAFDKNSFLTSMIHKRGDMTISSFAYTRDALGNRTSMITGRGIASYGYDQELRITSVSNTEISSADQKETFAYDNLGNRLSDQHGSFVYDSKSQRLVQDYRYDYYYDNNGNLTKKAERGLTGNLTNYVYSSENQLVKIEEFKNDSLVMRAKYFYDAIGRRINKQVESIEDPAASLTRKFVYDGQEILSELDERDQTLLVYTHSTLRTDDVLAADVRSSRIAQLGSYSYLKDGLGSITDIIDNNGNLIQHYSYSSYGKIVSIKDVVGVDISDSAPFKNRYSYTNREFDEESGLYYYRARYFDPGIGRFISEDPHPGILSIPSTYSSSYVYGLNNPIRYTDPSGEIIPAIIIGAMIGAVANAYFNRDNGKSFLHNLAVGAVVGGLSAGVGAGVAAGIGWYIGGWAGAIIGGAAGGAAAAGTSQYITTGKVTARALLFGALLGAVSGAISYGVTTNSPGAGGTMETVDGANKGAVNTAIEESSPKTVPEPRGAPKIHPPIYIPSLP
ncbi:MAG TPA: RHS repeat-associated core domain-containing protein [Bacteriovoracaceae bacterium]|nr:RHS repeat-associated core domain-containing protein [Bacteriovoracaceae bacterium]